MTTVVEKKTIFMILLQSLVKKLHQTQYPLSHSPQGLPTVTDCIYIVTCALQKQAARLTKRISRQFIVRIRAGISESSVRLAIDP